MVIQTIENIKYRTQANCLNEVVYTYMNGVIKQKNEIFIGPCISIFCTRQQRYDCNLRNQQNCCRPHCHHLGYSVLPSTSLYHLVPKHLRTTWSRPEQSHLLPETCSPNGTDNIRQRQRRTKRPPPEPSNIHNKRFYALYDDKGTLYYMKKVSKRYCFLKWCHQAKSSHI